MVKNKIDTLSNILGFSPVGMMKYLKNTLWLFGERFITMLIGVGVGIAVARYLEPYNYGVIQYGFILYAIAVNIGSLGLDDLIMREALKDPSKEGAIMGTALYMRVITCILTFFGVSIFSFFTTESGNFLPAVVIIGGILFQPLGVLAVYFQMKVQGRLRATAIMIGYSAAAALKVVLILIKAPLIYFAFAMAFDTVITMLFLFILYLWGNSFKGWRFDKTIATYFFKMGWPLVVIIVCGSLYSKIDMLLVKNLLGVDSLGIYSAAVRLTEVWYHIPIALSLSLFPAMLNAKSTAENGIQEKAEYTLRMEKVFRLLAAGSILMGLFVTFTAQYIVDILYQEDYSAAGPCLGVFIWCLLFVSFNTISLKWLMMEDEIMLSFYRSLASVVVNLGLNYFLIKYYGIKGAAWGTLLSYAFLAYFIDLFSKKTLPLFMMKTRSLVFPIKWVYGCLKK